MRTCTRRLSPMLASILVALLGFAGPVRGQAGSQRAGSTADAQQAGAKQAGTNGTEERSSAGVEGHPPRTLDDLAHLVEDLGHERWERRETAQARLQKQGAAIVHLLREAASSDDPELARRARRLRELVDPLVGVFEVLEIDLSGGPRVRAVARGSCASGEPFTMSFEPSPQQQAESHSVEHIRPSSGSRFSLTWQPVADESFDVEVSEIPQRSTTPVPLRPALGLAPSLSLLKVGEIARYARADLIESRERFPFIVVMRQRYVRRSDLPPTTRSDGSKLLEDLLAELVAQVSHEAVEARAQAIEILGFLRHVKARPVLIEALDEPRLRFPASLALGRLSDPRGLEELQQILRDAAKKKADSGADADPFTSENQAARIRAALARGAAIDETDRIRAAAILAQTSDDPEKRRLGLSYLVGRLENRDLTELHTIYGTLSDHSESIAADQELRRRFLSFALHLDSIVEAPWSFFGLETEHFFTRALELLSVEDAEDRQLASAAMAGLEGLLVGRGNFIQLRFATVLPLWKLAASAAFEEEQPTRGEEPSKDRHPPSTKPGDELSLLQRALTGVGSSVGLSEIASRLRTVHRGRRFSDDFLDTLFESLLRLSSDADENLAKSARRYAREISSSLTIGPGQLELVVRGLHAIEASAYSPSRARRSPSSSSTRSTSSTYSVASELTRLTGVTLPRRISRTDEPPIPLEKIVTWLADEEAISKRQAEIDAERDRPDDRSPRLELYDFEFVTNESDIGPAFELLSGEGVLLRAGETLRASREGEGVYTATLVPSQTRSAATSKSTRSTRTPPKRYRLNGTTWLTEGAYHMTTATRATSAEKWYEVSDVAPRARYLQVSSSTRVRRLVFVTMADDSNAKALASLQDAGETRLEQLWRHFLDRHLLRVPENPGSNERSSIVKAIRTFQLEEAIPMLKTWLAESPNFDLAGLLSELGDPAGRDYLRSQLESPSVTARIAAARALSESGDETGMEALLRLSKDAPRDFSQSAYTILGSFEKFIARSDKSSSVRLRAIDLVLERLDQSRYQSIGFRIVGQLAGTDFGYAQSRVRTAPRTPGSSGTVTRRIPQAQTITEARAWWQRERARLSSTEKSP